MLALLVFACLQKTMHSVTTKQGLMDGSVPHWVQRTSAPACVAFIFGIFQGIAMSSPVSGSQGVSRRWVNLAGLSAAAVVGLPTIARAQAGTGVSATEVRLGQTAALTGPLSFANLQANTAANAYFSEVNKRGGVAGRKISLTSLDDQFDPAKALANFKQLQTDNGGVLAMFGVGGTPANLAIQPLVEEGKLINFAPYSGFDGLRKPGTLHTFHIRAAYGQEFAKMAAYCNTSGLKDVTVLYSDNAFGKGSLQYFEGIAAKVGVKVKGRVMMPDKVDDLGTITKALAAAGGQAIIGVVASSSALAWAKSELPKLGVPYLTISLLGNELSVKFLGDSAFGIVVAQTVPYPRSKKYPISGELNALGPKYGIPEPGFTAMEGYIAARVMVEALTRAGKNLSRQSLEAALTSAKFDLKGFVVDFTGGNRSGSSFVELSQVNREGRFVQ
jgi:branched-chain amino acid transport system substrate-binding protein